jgi:hypothetical protein
VGHPEQAARVILVPEVGDHTDVVLWRVTQFQRLGFEKADAMLLADEGVDWHEAERLLEQGCDPHLALMLLLPLPD